MSKKPVRVAVTGAAGQIGYAILFRIASGEMLGKDQPVVLSLLEVPMEKAQQALQGVMMELQDCAFPLVVGMEAHSDPMTAFKDVDYALLIGSRPRGPGMERAELLAVNAEIFTAQGKALNAVASRDVRVLVVGNPANTNAYIAMKSAPDLPRKNFTAMLRLDHNRALSQLAEKTGKFLPTEPRARIAVFEWLMFQMAGFGPMPGQVHHFLGLSNEDDKRYGLARYMKETRRLYGVMDQRLASHTFFAGEISIADFAILGWAWRHQRHQVDLNDFPNVKRWYDTMMARPAVQRGFAVALK